MRDSGKLNERQAKRMMDLKNVVLANKFLEEARLDYELAHKLDDDYWGEEGPPIKKVDLDD